MPLWVTPAVDVDNSSVFEYVRTHSEPCDYYSDPLGGGTIHPDVPARPLKYR